MTVIEFAELCAKEAGIPSDCCRSTNYGWYGVVQNASMKLSISDYTRSVNSYNVNFKSGKRKFLTFDVDSLSSENAIKVGAIIRAILA